MIGPILALLSGFSFAFSVTFMRKGIYRTGETFSPVAISIVLGTILLGITLFISGQAKFPPSLSWLGVWALAVAGILHFVIGRFLAFNSFRLIGANRAAPINRCSIFFAALIGIVFLGEPLTISLFLALLVISGGIVFMSTRADPKVKLVMPESNLTRGVFSSLSAGLCWGISPVLVKIGLGEANFPLLSTFISYAAASVLICGLSFDRKNRQKLRQLTSRSLIPIIIASIGASVSQILTYTALSYSPVSVVTPIVGSSGLLVVPLSFVLNRQIESFSARTIVGGIGIIVGILILFSAA